MITIPLLEHLCVLYVDEGFPSDRDHHKITTGSSAVSVRTIVDVSQVYPGGIPIPQGSSMDPNFGRNTRSNTF